MNSETKRNFYFQSLYLGMYIAPISPNDIRDDYWNPLLGMDHKKELVPAFVELGYLTVVGNTKDGHPIYQCTEKGRELCESWLGVKYNEISSEMGRSQKSVLLRVGKWVIKAAADGIIGNRADALFAKILDAFQLMVKKIIKEIQVVTLSG